MGFDAGNDLNAGGTSVLEGGRRELPGVRFLCDGGEEKGQGHAGGGKKYPCCFLEIGRPSRSIAARRSSQT